MLTIPSANAVYTMSWENPPAAWAKSGDTLCFETLDCYAGQITTERPCWQAIDWSLVNPATGPLYIEDAMPGDVLKVEILDIRVASQGVMADGPGRGITGQAVAERTARLFPVEDGFIRFNETLRIPIRPMIGVIGTAPAEAGIDTGTPGPHGGNMDCKLITAGSVLYLPVAVEGALLALGDLHARMGDGEVAICGLEIGGSVTVRVTVVKDCSLPTPFLVNADRAAAIWSEKTLEDASKGATMAMHSFLTGELGLTAHEAGMLLSIAGDLRICQVVDPLITCRMELPRSITEDCGYTFP